MNPPRLVQEYLEENTLYNPSRTAVTDTQSTLTYRDLSDLSNRLAHCLKQKAVTRQACVAFSLQRSVYSLAAIMGILKADAVYVPLDPKMPIERRLMILDDCKPSAIICDRSTFNQVISEFSTGPVVVLDPAFDVTKTGDSRIVGWQQIMAGDTRGTIVENCEDDLAYIMYTSGSTGQPKGVMITHRNICNYIDWAVECLGLCAEDRILGTAPLHFDMSTFDIHAAMKAGGTLCIASDLMTLFPEKLIRYIEDQRVTVWKGVSSLLMYMARTGTLNPERMPTLKTILYAGEVLPTRYLMQWMETFPGKKFINAYGPTEATGVSLYYPIPDLPQSSSLRIPIGRPCSDTEVFLLKEDMSVAQNGETGELCISGPCLARGYFNDPEKTAQVFIEPDHEKGKRYYRTGDLAAMRSDGNYEFISRCDRQVKVMGYRIELGEIEQAMMAIEGVDDVVALATESAQTDLLEIFACFESSSYLAVETVLQELKKKLPAYMLPKELVKVDRIPRNERGKIDRTAIYEERLRMVTV